MDGIQAKFDAINGKAITLIGVNGLTLKAIVIAENKGLGISIKPLETTLQIRRKAVKAGYKDWSIFDPTKLARKDFCYIHIFGRAEKEFYTDYFNGLSFLNDCADYLIENTHCKINAPGTINSCKGSSVCPY